MFSSFYRHENITLRTIITFDCPSVTSRQMAWTINSQVDGRAIVPSVPANHSSLSLTARSLPHGKYRFTFSVQLSDESAVFLSSKAFVIIEILSSIIQVNLLSSPLSTISHGVEQDLILDPGQYSIDPAEAAFPAHVSRSPCSRFCTSLFSIGITPTCIVSSFQRLTTQNSKPPVLMKHVRRDDD